VRRVRARYSIVKELLAGVLYSYGPFLKVKLVVKPAAQPLQAARRIFANMERSTI
jgi:hypothetical protein